MKPVLTALQGDNADLFAEVSRIYFKENDKILDMTYGLGVFYRRINCNQFQITKNDIDPQRGDIHYDFRNIPIQDNTFDIIVLDPPYAGRSGSPIKGSIDRGYNIYSRSFEQGIFGHEAVIDMYKAGLIEANRLVKPKGLIMVKTQDEIMGGVQRRSHIEIFDFAKQLGLIDEDLFVLVQNGTPTMRHDYQLHARKNNSFLWIFKRIK